MKKTSAKNSGTQPMYQRIRSGLLELIEQEKLQRHAKLPSESQLQRQYHASVGTVRKALADLEAENVIYRRHGQGAFVASRGRKHTIAIVSSFGVKDDAMMDDCIHFVMGALEEANFHDLPYIPVVMRLDELQANIQDIKMIYPELGGIIFFRSYTSISLLADTLKRQQLPTLYYGPNIYSGMEPLSAVLCSDERAMVEAMADHYAKRKYRNAILVEDELEIGTIRCQMMSEALKKRGISSLRFHYSDLLVPETLCSLIGNYDVLFAPFSRIAIPLIQILERDLGFRIPRDIAVSGIDNITPAAVLRPSLTVIDLCNHKNGARAIRFFSEHEGSVFNECFRMNADFELIVRESC